MYCAAVKPRIAVKRNVVLGQQKRTFATEAPLKPKDKLTVQKDGTIKVDFGTNPFKGHRLDTPKPQTTTSRDELMNFFKEMSVMRRVELACQQLYQSKLIRGFLHLYNGQEAIVAGYEAICTKEDHVITAYREHAHYLGRGGTPYETFCELFGKAPGCSAGKGGSMHFYKKDANFHGGNGIVGAQGAVGTGVAFGCKYHDNKKVCLTFYGDGAANQGQLFEAYNMAMLWKLPVIYVCENNKYGMGTSVERSSYVTDYFTRGDYVPGMKIDAMNVLAVKEGVKFARDWAVNKGPIILEMETYRYMGHSMSDPGLSYRTRAEVDQVKAERDPIEKVRFLILDNKLATEEELTAIEKQIKKDVDDAVKAAQEAPFPADKELYSDIFIDKPYYARAVEWQDSQIVQ
jgi:pyruvate dehydrogenase E1 component alpha subunit